MTYVDAASYATQFQSIGATLTQLGQALSDANGPGAFQSILSQMSTTLASLDPPANATPAAASSPLSTLFATGTQATSSPSGDAVVADATKYLGVPYQWGGTNPATGLDCSGLVQRVYSDLGISLPRTSQEQATVGSPVASLADAQPGDLVFFAGSDGTATSPGHVGIYIGNGQMIDAPHTGTDVQVQAVGTPTAIRRIVATPTTGAPAATDTAAATAPGSIPASLGVPASLVPVFQAAGQRYGVPPALLAAVAKQESGFQTSVVSSAGAEGLMQLMPSTASGLGVNPLDPAQAVDGAARLLSSYLARYNGSVPLSLAAYNAGPGAVAQYGGVPPYSETQNYVSSITAMLSGVTL